MAKPEWGVKRTCRECGAKFYDMQKNPVICPKCDAEFVEETATKGRRKRAAKEEQAETTANTAEEAVLNDDEEIDDDLDLDLEIEDEEDDLMALDDDEDDNDVEGIEGIKVENSDKEE